MSKIIDGEYSLVDSDKLREISGVVDELRTAILKIAREVDITKKETLDGIDKFFDILKNELKDLDIDEIIKMIENLQKIVDESDKIHIDTPQVNAKGTGGKIGTTTYNGENVGGVIVKKDDTRDIEGEYVDKEPIDEGIKHILEELAKLTNDISNKEKAEEIRKQISEFVGKNFDELAEKCQESAKDLPEVAEVTKVTKKRSFDGLKRVAIVALSIATIASFISKSQDYSIAIEAQDPSAITLETDIETTAEDVIRDIQEKYQAGINAGHEAEVNDQRAQEVKDAKEELGMDDTKGPEVASREGKLESTQQLDSIRNQVNEIKTKFNAIQNPTNAQKLDYSIQLHEQLNKLLDLGIEVNEQTIKNLDLWEILNNLHIDSGSIGPNAIRDHIEENEANEKREQEILDKNETNKENIENNNKKIEFLKALKGVDTLEDIKNIDEAVETIWTFMQSDLGKEIGQDEIIKLASDTHVNLLSEYIKNAGNIQTKEEFLAKYLVVENTFDEYFITYANMDETKVDESTYVPYTLTALEQYEQKIGNPDEFKISGQFEQNELNRNYYNQYGKKVAQNDVKTGRFSRLVEGIKTFLNSRRRGEYRDLIETLKEISKQQENNIKQSSIEDDIQK